MRARENLTALKGNEAAKRFVEELNRAEDDIQAARKEHAPLVQQRDAARARLDGEIAKVSFETDLAVVTQKTQTGSAPQVRYGAVHCWSVGGIRRRSSREFGPDPNAGGQAA